MIIGVPIIIQQLTTVHIFLGFINSCYVEIDLFQLIDNLA